MRILISEFMDEAAVGSLARRFDVRYDAKLVDRRDDLLAGLADADALIVRNRTQVDAALLARAPKLRVVGRLGVGLDNIDVAACAARGIEVIPATGANALAVAEYVVVHRDAAAARRVSVHRRGRGRQVAARRARRGPRDRRKDARRGRLRRHRTTGREARAGLGMKVLATDPAVAADAPVWRERACDRGLDDLLASRTR